MKHGAEAVVTITITLGCAFALSCGGCGSDGLARGKKRALAAITRGDAVAAKNATKLVLMHDAHKVVGWIAGTESYRARWAVVKLDKKRVASVAVDEHNFFVWRRPALKKAVDATFSIGRMTRTIRLETPEKRRAAFFVVDRPAYRPGQTLRFAAFLHHEGKTGGYQAHADKTVDVRLESQKKRVVIARLKLKSDAFGRVVGRYRFSSADPLDDYVLSAVGHAGQARIKLAEFRKAKVKLLIAGKPQGTALTLRLSAIDFAGKPVAGSRVQLEAQVVRDASGPADRKTKTSTRGLNPRAFVFAPTAGPLPRADALSADARLVLQAGLGTLPPLRAVGGTVVATRKATLSLAGKKGATHHLPLDESWLDGAHSVRVRAVMVDENGHEQRAYRAISLRPADSDRIALTLARRVVGMGQPLHLRARVTRNDKQLPLAVDSQVVVVQRLGDAVDGPRRDRLHRPAYWGLSSRIYPSTYGRSATRNILRTLVTAQALRPVPAGTGPAATSRFRIQAVRGATLSLARPGAYKLVVITRLKTGARLRSEIGCVVRAERKIRRAALSLRLAAHTLTPRSQTSLSGRIDSRYRDARVIVTLRDGSGLRSWQRVTLSGTSAPFRLRAPRNLGHRALVIAQYVDHDGRVHLADRAVAVRSAPALAIETEMKKKVKPGAQVGVKIRVRETTSGGEKKTPRGPVELVVSVYDESLLGIGFDRTPDPRSFFYADTRVLEARDLLLLRRRLGGLTLAQIVDRVAQRLKSEPKLKKTPDGRQVLGLTTSRRGRVWFNGRRLVALLRLYGIDARSHGHVGWYRHIKDTEWQRSLAYLLTAKQVGRRAYYRLSWRVYGDTVVFASRYQNPNRNVHALGYRRNRRGSPRGDAHYSITANASHSVSAQAFVSHLPAAMQPALLSAGRQGSRFAVRTNFSDSAFFSARLRTDGNGEARISFKLPDSLTNWRVVVTAISPDGNSAGLAVGRHQASFRSDRPVMVWPLVPRSFTTGDTVALQARVHNRTKRTRRIKVALVVKNGKVLSPATRELELAPMSSALTSWSFAPGKPGYTEILMTADSSVGSDASLKRLPVAPATAEQRITASGFASGVARLSLPPDVDAASARLEISVAPSLAADLVDNLAYLVEYPYGCVEQTMSRFLPAIKVAQVLTRFRLRHRALEAKLPRVVAAGIKRLLVLQKKDGGWGWHGGSRTHEMMTPYALFGLLEAEKAGYKTHAKPAIDRGLKRLRGFIAAMGERQAADRIYSMYVYSQRKKVPASWWLFIDNQLKAKKLSDYALALALEMAVVHEKVALSKTLARALNQRAVKSGGQVHFRTAGFSRWGDDPFEITAAALKALVAYDVDHPLVAGMLAYFAATKRGHRWNSTKDTAMITYAIADYLAKQKQLRPSKAIAVRINGGTERTLRFSDGLSQSVRIPARALRSGENRIVFTRGSRVALYRAVLHYSLPARNAKAVDAGVHVKRRFFLLGAKGQKTPLASGDRVPLGAYVLAEVTATQSGTKSSKRLRSHATQAAWRYLLVESPKPSGAEALPVSDKRYDQSSSPYALREDRTDKIAFHHERAPSTLKDRAIFHVEHAGTLLVPPARVELMYDTKTYGHSAGFVLAVTASAKM